MQLLAGLLWLAFCMFVAVLFVVEEILPLAGG
jgi:hypothetical protein